MMLKRLFLWALLASLAAAAFIGIAIFVLGDFGETQVKLLLTTLVIGGFSLTAMAGAAALAPGRGWAAPLPYAGIAASILAAAMALAMTWELGEPARRDGWDWRLLASLTVVAVSTGHLSMLSIVRPTGFLALMCRRSAVLFAAAVAVLLVIGILAQPDAILTREVYVRLLGVLLILDVLANVALLLLIRLSPGRPTGGGARSPGRKRAGAVRR